MNPAKKLFFQVVAVFILSHTLLYFGLANRDEPEEPGTVWLTIGDVTFRGPVGLRSSPVRQPDGTTVYTITTPKYDLRLSASPR